MAAWVGWGTVPARARDASGLDGIEGRRGMGLLLLPPSLPRDLCDFVCKQSQKCVES